MLSYSSDNSGPFSGYKVKIVGVTTWIAAGRKILRVQCRAGSGPAHCRHCEANPCQAGRGAGRKRQKMQKVNTTVLELECVVCGLVAAADLQLSGGPAGWVQEMNQLVRS